MSRPVSSYCGRAGGGGFLPLVRTLGRASSRSKHEQQLISFDLLVAHRRGPTRAKRRATRGTPFRAGGQRSPMCTFGLRAHSLLLSWCEFRCRLVGRVLSQQVLADSLAKRQPVYPICNNFGYPTNARGDYRQCRSHGLKYHIGERL